MKERVSLEEPTGSDNVVSVLQRLPELYLHPCEVHFTVFKKNFVFGKIINAIMFTNKEKTRHHRYT